MFYILYIDLKIHYKSKETSYTYIEEIFRIKKRPSLKVYYNSITKRYFVKCYKYCLPRDILTSPQKSCLRSCIHYSSVVYIILGICTVLPLSLK